ncbi:aminoglycoside phosphotransferase family protein [Salirhabdus sp. Marseille-P4669]|uniref:aminoglycoside phosphotransferase family protein n=1 Tax=Salirhabdus sp. Marseille-P4669 TaxID=2042310 RepID=UPI001357B903|nr:aminoglycoside phosphotransferase family protein [Salirhabdus sp. Marseille-P4669]
MKIPHLFIQTIHGAFGDKGREWLESLEQIISVYLEKWGLHIIGPVEKLSYNYVLRVKDKKNTPYILKLGVPSFDFRNEVQTVIAYNGEGCARWIKADPDNGVLLLEQLSPGKMLSELDDEEKVIEEYVNVWMRIKRPLHKNSKAPMIADWAEALQRYLLKYPNNNGPIANQMVQHALECFEEITKTSKGLELLHGDLHHENILFSKDRGWLAIDPKGVIGDPYFDVAAFLYNHLFTKPNPRKCLENRIQSISEKLDLNAFRLIKASFAMSTLSACWAVGDMSEGENSFQCAKWLLEMLGGINE